MMAKTISGIFNKAIPLNKNMHEGMIERDNAFNFPVLFQRIIQKIKYKRHNVPFTDKYTARE